MGYTKNTWATGDAITAVKLNNLETQYDQLLALDRLWFRDDFVGVQAGFSPAYTIVASGSAAGAIYDGITFNGNGVYRISVPNSAEAFQLSLQSGGTGEDWVKASLNPEIEAYIATNLVTQQTIEFGFGNGTTPSEGAYLVNDPVASAVGWVLRSRKASTSYDTSCSPANIPVAGTYQKLKVQLTTAAIRAYINGALVATYATPANITTDKLYPRIRISSKSTVARYLYLDYWDIKQDRDTVIA